MTAPAHPITFTESGRGNCRSIEALLNNTLVGIISPYPYAGGETFGTVTHLWDMRLPVNGGAMLLRQPATSLQKAKVLLLNRIAQWHEAADEVRYAEMIADLKAQAEAEKGVDHV